MEGSMSYRPRLVLVLSLLVLLTLMLSACNRERPVPTTTTTTPAAARGTVAAPTPLTRGLDSVTPEAGTAASGAPTPSAPSPQQVVVSPAASTGAATTGQSSTYTVVAGDTLATIAARFGTTPEAIAQLNSLADPNALTLGQKLLIPAAAGSQGAGAQPTTGAAASGTAAGGATTGAATAYTVQQGDTLGAIAKRYGTTVQAIVAANGLANADNIKVGQKLTIPGGSSAGATVAPSTSGQSRTYVVQRGDTLLSIARRFGLTVKQLQQANNIANPDRIYPGQTLVIP
jgi:LysM repeat protein